MKVDSDRYRFQRECPVSERPANDLGPFHYFYSLVVEQHDAIAHEASREGSFQANSCREFERAIERALDFTGMLDDTNVDSRFFFDHVFKYMMLIRKVLLSPLPPSLA
jgi:hypothetical protein